jgi:hypothetical protein
VNRKFGMSVMASSVPCSPRRPVALEHLEKAVVEAGDRERDAEDEGGDPAPG